MNRDLPLPKPFDSGRKATTGERLPNPSDLGFPFKTFPEIYLTPTKNHWAADIEADNLLDKATKIYILCLENVLTKERVRCFSKEEFDAFNKENPEAILVGHNFLAYDGPMLNRHWRSALSVGRIVDTFVLSQLYNPNLAGGHSLDSWGRRLGLAKIDFHDFSALTPEMVTYCERDVSLTAELYRRLTARMRQHAFSELGCWIEHRAWHIIQNKQKRNGFPFDIKKAELLYAEIRTREEQLREEIHGLWPPELRLVASYGKAFKKDGSPSANYDRHKQQYVRVDVREDGGYDCYDYVSFNLGSPSQRVEKLLELGWKPVNWNVAKKDNPAKGIKRGDKTSPKVDEDSLLAFSEASGKPEIAALAKWLVCNSRANMVRTWMDAYNPATGAIHGSLYLAGTLRYRHGNPNSANIPAVRIKKVDGKDEVLYGEEGTWAYECRDLFDAGREDGWVLVGVDAKGIQLRVLANYAFSEEFANRVLSGDPHTKNIEVLGLANKAAAKKFLYCVPLDSKALTKRGWKTYDELIEGELILTYNAEKHVKEWQPLKAKHYFDRGPLIKMGHGHGFEVRSTPNHRWFTRQRKHKTPGVRETRELSTMQEIIVNAPLEEKADNAKEIIQLSKYGTDWVQAVLDMSSSQREAFLAGFCIADGHWHKNGHWCWVQNDGPLFEAALLASYLVSEGVCRVSSRTLPNGKVIKTCSIGKKGHVTTNSFKYEDLGEKPVWCPETDNHSWVMRQGDVITITGNTTLMGGGGAKLAVDQAQFGTHLTAADGNRLKDLLISSVPGFKELIKRLQQRLKRSGRIQLCDGTPILVPSDHMVIPYLLQGDESRLMKMALIILDVFLRMYRLEDSAKKVTDVHDEWQWKVRTEHADLFIALALRSFVLAGEFFKYRVPIEGDAKCGKTWAETH